MLAPVRVIGVAEVLDVGPGTVLMVNWSDGGTLSSSPAPVVGVVKTGDPGADHALLVY